MPAFRHAASSSAVAPVTLTKHTAGSTFSSSRYFWSSGTNRGAVFSPSSVTTTSCSTYCRFRRSTSTAAPTEVPPPAVIPVSAVSHAARSGPAASTG